MKKIVLAKLAFVLLFTSLVVPKPAKAALFVGPVFGAFGVIGMVTAGSLLIVEGGNNLMEGPQQICSEGCRYPYFTHYFENISYIVLGAGLFVLDAETENKTNLLKLDSFLLEELSLLAQEKSKDVVMDENGIKKIILSDDDFNYLIGLASFKDKEILSQAKNILTK